MRTFYPQSQLLAVKFCGEEGAYGLPFGTKQSVRCG